MLTFKEKTIGCGGPGGKTSFAAPFLYRVALRSAECPDDFKRARKARTTANGMMLRNQYQIAVAVLQVERMPAVAAVCRRARIGRNAAVCVIGRH